MGTLTAEVVLLAGGVGGPRWRFGPSFVRVAGPGVRGWPAARAGGILRYWKNLFPGGGGGTA